MMQPSQEPGLMERLGRQEEQIRGLREDVAELKEALREVTTCTRTLTTEMSRASAVLEQHVESSKEAMKVIEQNGKGMSKQQMGVWGGAGAGAGAVGASLLYWIMEALSSNPPPPTPYPF